MNMPFRRAAYANATAGNRLSRTGGVLEPRPVSLAEKKRARMDYSEKRASFESFLYHVENKRFL
jgi:hypothetical protein